ncbi:hypothetical protein BGZ81_009253 [Podila clonocystis]|nr:hypothetical protein BGZ81_009253 [Podila clonocystis]
MIPAGTNPMRWIALGSLAMMMLHSTFAEECSPPVTVTKTETTTIWADGSWPTSTVTQLVHPDNCPPEPRYSCYVVSTTTLSTPFPKATIHMVLPQEQHSRNAQEEADGSSKENHEDDNEDEPKAQNEIHETPTPAITVPNLPVPAPTGPACVHYVTTIGLAPCATFKPLPLNSDGCAIVTSTSLALTAATAVPEIPYHKKDGDVDATYTYSIGTESTHCHKHKHHKHHKHPKPTITPVPESPFAPMAPPHVPQLDDPTEMGTSFTTHFSTRYSYTMSFEFNYGTTTPLPSRLTGYPELPGPTTPPGITRAAGPRSDPTSAPPAPESMPPVPSPDTTTAPVVVPPPGPTPTENPLVGTGSEVVGRPPVTTDPPTTTTVSDLVVTVDSLTTTPVANPFVAMGLPTTTLPAADPVVTVDPPAPNPTPTPIHKACDACAEPCVVEADVVVNAEVPLLVRLFQDKTKNALASLRISLEDQTGAAATGADDAAGVFGKLTMDVNAETASMFRKACETKIREVEARQFAGLRVKVEQVVGSTCETGQCLQAELDKAVRLLDVMVSTELARDASQLRGELVREFETRYVEEDKKRAVLAVSADADATLEKRSGLLGSLLGPVVGDTLDKVVDKVGNDVVTQVSPPLGELVKDLVDALTGTVKNVVDSFVSNCNRKGLLDFDTEHGVGSLAAIVNVSLDLFKLVCVKANKANVDVKADAAP